MNQRTAKWTGTVLIILAVAGIVMISLVAGRYSISFSDLVQILQGEGKSDSSPLHAAYVVFFNSRLARVVAAAVIGASLSCSGAVCQGIFHNPMVSPDILGAGTGAAFGAVLAIYLGGSTVVVQLSAFLFGLLAVGFACFSGMMVAGKEGGTAMTLVLTGMVTGSLFSALISVVKFLGDPYDTLPTITFWLMGGLTYVTLSDVLILLVPFAVGVIPVILLRWRLNLLSMSDEEAGALGISPFAMRILFILCATLMASSSVAVGGMIGWVGLIVPHIARMLVGPDYARLIPCSLLIGAGFLMLTDDLARCLSALELPLGVLTALVGAPFFLWLLYRGRKSFL